MMKSNLPQVDTRWASRHTGCIDASWKYYIALYTVWCAADVQHVHTHTYLREEVSSYVRM